MTKKKSAENIMKTSTIKDSATADAMVQSADAVIAVEPVAAREKEATMSADEDTLLKEAYKRGNISLKVTAGTEEVRNVNAKNKGINTGSAQPNHTNVVKLKIDFPGKKA